MQGIVRHPDMDGGLIASPEAAELLQTCTVSRMERYEGSDWVVVKPVTAQQIMTLAALKAQHDPREKCRIGYEHIVRGISRVLMESEVEDH